MFGSRAQGAHFCGMSMFFKVMVGLLLTLPVGAYVAGSVVASHADKPAEARLVRVGDSTPAGKDATPAPRPSPLPRVGHTSDDESENSDDSEDWQGSDHGDHGDDGEDHTDHHGDDHGDGDGESNEGD